VRLRERPLQLVQLRRREPGPVAFLLQAVVVARGGRSSFGSFQITGGHWWMHTDNCKRYK